MQGLAAPLPQMLAQGLAMPPGTILSKGQMTDPMAGANPLAMQMAGSLLPGWGQQQAMAAIYGMNPAMAGNLDFGALAQNTPMGQRAMIDRGIMPFAPQGQ